MRRDTLYHAQINSLFACMIYRGRSYGWVLMLGVILSDDEQVLVSSDLLTTEISNLKFMVASQNKLQGHLISKMYYKY